MTSGWTQADQFHLDSFLTIIPLSVYSRIRTENPQADLLFRVNFRRVGCRSAYAPDASDIYRFISIRSYFLSAVCAFINISLRRQQMFGIARCVSQNKHRTALVVSLVKVTWCRSCAVRLNLTDFYCQQNRNVQWRGFFTLIIAMFI